LPWPRSVLRGSPLAASHRRIVFSSPPLSTSVPLGEKATDRTGPSWPESRK
jgi:hypothetical protein